MGKRKKFKIVDWVQKNGQGRQGQKKRRGAQKVCPARGVKGKKAKILGGERGADPL